ncbi:MAG: hypothetical protein JSS04_26235 [Proteobacteria bacterium]|nr:hypothetical protein [Pseudomonadota bacterium]
MPDQGLRWRRPMTGAVFHRLGSVFDRFSNDATARKCRGTALLSRRLVRKPFKNGENGRNGERATMLLPSPRPVGHSAAEGEVR